MKISREEAIAHRFRRVYLLLLSIILGAWAIRVAAFADDPWPASAAVGDVPGMVVTTGVVAGYLACLVIALRPRTWESEDELHQTDVGQHH